MHHNVDNLLHGDTNGLHNYQGYSINCYFTARNKPAANRPSTTYILPRQDRKNRIDLIFKVAN